MIIKNFNGGLSPTNQGGVVGSYKEGYNLLTRRKEDTLTCGYKWEQLSSLNGEVIVKFITMSKGIFAFCASGKVYRALTGANTDWTEIYDANGSYNQARISGACLYNDGTDVWFYIMIEENNGGRKKRLIKATPGVSSLTPIYDTGQTWAEESLYSPMEMNMNKLLFSMGTAIGMIDENGVHQYEEDFQDNLKIVCMTSYNNYVLVGCEDKDASTSRIKVLDVSDIQVDMVKEIVCPFTRIEAIINGTDSEGIYIVGNSNEFGGNSKLYSCNLTTITPIAEIGGSSSGMSYGNKDECATICTTDGIYQFGRNTYYENLSLTKTALPQTNTPETYGCGRISDNSGIVCVAGYNSGGTLTYYTYKENKDKYNTAFYETIDIYPSEELSQTTTVREIKLNMAPLPAGCKVRVGIRISKGNSITWLYPTSGNSAHDEYFDDTGKNDVFFNVSKSYDIFSICIELTPNNTGTKATKPEIYLITVK